MRIGGSDHHFCIGRADIVLRKSSSVLLAITMLTASASVQALAQEDKGDSAPQSGAQGRGPLGETEEAIVEALKRTLELLSKTLDTLTIYELPEILPNGDIIIRRKPPQREPEKEEPASPDEGLIQL